MKLILNCFGYKYRKVSPQITQIYTDYFTIEDAEDTEEDKGKLRSGQTEGSSYRSNYWIYDPLTDLWDGEDLTDFEGSTRSKAVCFSTGKRGIIATGGSSTYYYDDIWELKPYEYEEK